MRLARRVALVLIVDLALQVVACAPRPIQTRTAPEPASQGHDLSDLIVLLPDPDSGTVGRATVSNAFGMVDLAGARAATVVARNQAPAPVTTLTDAELQLAIGSAFDALPPAPQNFILNFRFDSDELTAESRAVLPEILQTVKRRPVPDVLVVGHTDTTGPPARNVALGLKRAEIMRKLLVETGLDASLIEIASHGEADLLVPTADEVAEPRNRRVDITVR